MNSNTNHPQWASLIFAASLIASPVASADAVCDWNTKAGEIVVSARMGPPPANRAMAIANTAVYEAVNAITKRYPAGALKLEAAPGASVDAAIAAANRTALAKLLPSQQAAIDSRLSSGASENSRRRSQDFGHRSGRAGRCGDPCIARRRRRCCGRNIPTANGCRCLRAHGDTSGHALAAAQALADDQSFAIPPGPPPALTSALWARDFNEVKALGGKSNSRRTAEQTQIAGFWEATLPPIYQRHRAVSRRCSRSRGDAERSTFCGGGASRRRCAARGIRRQVSLQLLAAGYRDPQRRPRRQRRDGAGCLVDAVHRNADAPGVSVRALHRRRQPSALCSRRRSAPARCRH